MTGKHKQKRIRPQPGDLFEFACRDGRLGYGLIVLRSAGGLLYVVIFAPIHHDRPQADAVLSDGIALQGWTMDALIYHGRWTVIARRLARPKDIHFPNWKVEIGGETYATTVGGEVLGPIMPSEHGLLNLQFSCAPISYQEAFEARHGLREWDARFDELTPQYAARRATRAAV